MSHNIIMRREGKGLFPIDQLGIDALSRIPDGGSVTAVVTQSRNLRFHKMFFGLLSLVYGNQDQFATMDGLLDAVKVSIGHFDERTSLDGRMFVVPRSISFAKMDNESFRQFYDRALSVILEKVLPNTNKEDLEQAVYDLIREPGPKQLERV